MDTTQIVEQVKEVIMNDLLTNVDDKHCVLDLCIENRYKNSQNLNQVSKIFLENQKNELIEEYDSGKILFFRKYNYEKILNQYLESKYSIGNMGFYLFLSEKKRRRLEEKRKKVLKEKQGRQLEEHIIKQVPSLKWKKTIGVSSDLYTAVDRNGKQIKLHYLHGSIGKHNKTDNKLIYDNQPLRYAEYNVKSIVNIIEKTNPTSVKERYDVVTIDKNNKIKQEHEKIIQQNCMELIQKLCKEYELDIASLNEIIRQIQTKCSYYEKENCIYLKRRCMPYQKQCIDYYRLISKILEKSKEQNIAKKETVNSDKYEQLVDNKQQKIVHKIGVKDFVVRGNVFKCMHNKHKIDNVDARIYIDNDGKKEQVKISAGYCSECRTYFILESTYQKLKKHGMILCRVTDEKNYMKSGYINGMKLAQESLLMQYGYNVSQTEGLSATGRQKILAVIIDNKIMAKSEIISYLDFFISQRSSMNNMGIAISKWETDREFVENYKIGQYTQYGVKAIYRK